MVGLTGSNAHGTCRGFTSACSTTQFTPKECSASGGEVWQCPFRNFHCCKDGRPGSKGFTRLLSHIKRDLFKSADRKGCLRDALSSDLDLLRDVEETLKVFDQWLCGRCMALHALSRVCRHSDGVSLSAPVSDGEVDRVVGLPKPCQHAAPVGSYLTGDVPADVALLERILSLPVKTVKSIPSSCRLAFAHPLTSTLRKVVAAPGSVDAWVKLLLLPRCTLRVVTPSCRQERRSGNRKSLKCSSIQQALAGWKDGSGFSALVSSLLVSPRGRLVSGEEHRDGVSAVSSNVRQCLRKVADGHFTAAVKVLCSSGVAPINDSTLNALKDKHPDMPPPVLPSILLAEPALLVDKDCVVGCIKSFPKGTSCGRDGLRAQHLLDAMCGEGSATASGLASAITDVVNLWLGGNCPRFLAEFVASAPLTPLLKPDNGIRPIVVGAIWRRLVSKVAMLKVKKEMSAYLGDFQFGVGIPNGAEAVLHNANRFLNSFHSDGSMAMLTVDFSNAFNLVDRTALLREVSLRCPSISPWVQFLYAQPARLYVGDVCIGATTGVQQGDPLGPLLFALALHPLVLILQESCSLPFQAWYLDDGTLIGNTIEVAKALNIIQTEGPILGLKLNIKKTEVFWPSCNGLKAQEGIFPAGIERPDRGVKLLGGPSAGTHILLVGLLLKGLYGL